MGHAAALAVDIEKTAAFYRDALGFPEAFRMYNGEGGRLGSVHIFVGENQFIEIFPDGKPACCGVQDSRIHHICIQTDDIYADYNAVKERGAPIDSPVKEGVSKCLQFWTHDPDGNPVEFMQLQAGCLRSLAIERQKNQGAASGEQG